MKIAKITMLSLLFFTTILFSGCAKTPTVVTSNATLPQIKASSINLQIGDKTSFTLGKNENKSVVVFLADNERAYIYFVVTPTDFNSILDVSFSSPKTVHYGSGDAHTTTEKMLGDDGKGYYSTSFLYLIPPPEKINPADRDIYSMAPDTFEVSVSIEAIKP